MSQKQYEYLYHYTSIESLALILKNRSIRLCPLDKMDDLQEQKTADVENIGQFVFVSSWTDDNTESIPMWKMYTNSNSGVRIKLRKNPFIWHGTVGKDIFLKTGMKMENPDQMEERVNTFLDLSELLSKGYYSVQAWNGDILKKVVYTSDMNLLEPHVLCMSEDNISVLFGKLGLYKSEYWSFQHEWRYLMVFLPLDFQKQLNDVLKDFVISAIKIARGIEKPPFRYYDLQISEESFSEMEIMCSPQMSVGNRVILNALVKEFNPSANVVDSDLLGKI